MNKNKLLAWKESNAELYSKFKQDLEGQLLKPCHQTILDMGDGETGALQSAITNLTAITSEEGFDIDKLVFKDCREW